MKAAFVAALMAASLLAPSARAQATPSAEEMIEQLRPPQRTRSSRNLIIEQQPAPRPALSLLVQFAFDSAEVEPQSRQALQNLAQALQSPELAASRFAIEGHTDATGRPDYNLRLSQRRADAVRDLLASQGVAAARLQATGKGAQEPADPADPNAPANRRVRIVNLD
jgi:outer membrane protein OmpA-like peptidoglycan-associated protein